MFLYEEIRAQTYTERRPCENAGRTCPSTSQRDRSQKKPAMMILDLRLLTLRTVRKYIFVV